MRAQRFVHLFIAFAPNFSFIQAFKQQRARFLNKRPSLERQASELGETAEQPRFEVDPSNLCAWLDV